MQVENMGRAKRILAVWLLLASALGAATSGTIAGELQDSASQLGGEARGILRPMRRVSLSSDLAATVVRIPKRQGERFAKGDLLLEFDCERYRLEAQAAEAAAESAAIERRTSVRLLELGAAGRDDAGLARAALRKAEAELAIRQQNLANCMLTAPFDGQVVDIAVLEGEFPDPREPLLTILDDSAFEIELVVPATWLPRLETGMSISFTVDETGATIVAALSRLAAEIDPVSQMLKAYASVSLANQGDPQGRLLAGMSGTARFGDGS